MIKLLKNLLKLLIFLLKAIAIFFVWAVFFYGLSSSIKTEAEHHNLKRAISQTSATCQREIKSYE